MEKEIPKPKYVPPFEQGVPLQQTSPFPLGYIVACVYVIGSAVLIAVLPSNPDRAYVSKYLLVAILFGSLFGQTTSASIWATLGTGYHWVRLILALGWFFLLLFGTTLLMARMNGPDGTMLIVVAGTMLLQSFLIQVPLWCWRSIAGLRLVSRQEPAAGEAERVQFGIAHMMFFTAIVALILGMAQAMIRWLGADATHVGDGLPVFLYLGASAILVSLPIAVASLLDRHCLPALALATVFVVLVTGLAFPLMVAMGLQRSGPDFYDIISINLSVTTQVLAYSLGLRFFGHRLTMGKSGAKPIANASPW